MNCPACLEGIAPRFIESRFDPIGRVTYRLQSCPSCGVVFSDPAAPVEAAWYHQARMHEACSFSADWRHETFFDLCGLRGDLFDAGCGNGTFLRLAEGKGFSVSGVDFNPENINQAKGMGLKDVWVGDVQRFLADRSCRYDVVSAFDVLEHLPRPRLFLENIRAALRPRGQVALTFPNAGRPVPPLLRESFDYPPYHFTRWSQRAISISLRSVGFEVLDIRSSPLPRGFFSGLVYYKCLEAVFPLLKKIFLGADGAQSSETWTKLLSQERPESARRFKGLRRRLRSPERRQEMVDLGLGAFSFLLSPIEVPFICCWNRFSRRKGRTLFVLAQKT